MIDNFKKILIKLLLIKYLKWKGPSQNIEVQDPRWPPRSLLFTWCTPLPYHHSYKISFSIQKKLHRSRHHHPMLEHKNLWAILTPKEACGLISDRTHTWRINILLLSKHKDINLSGQRQFVKAKGVSNVQCGIDKTVENPSPSMSI